LRITLTISQVSINEFKIIEIQIKATILRDAAKQEGQHNLKPERKTACLTRRNLSLCSEETAPSHLSKDFSFTSALQLADQF
jgi:hypothetical protein